MSRMMSERRGSWLPEVGGAWGKQRGLAERTERKGPPTGLLIAGVVVVGLGLLAWSYVGADLRRYIKINSM